MRMIIMTGVMLSLAPLMQPGARANDSMFAPQPAAQAMVNFDGKGFLINGQRVFVASAGMEYARVPQALWADRLTRFKRAGFNCTEFYTFWNYHEPQSGQFDFSTNCDLNAYLETRQVAGTLRHCPGGALLLRRMGQRWLSHLAAQRAEPPGPHRQCRF
jgi:beta-galactosidase